MKVNQRKKGRLWKIKTSHNCKYSFRELTIQSQINVSFYILSRKQFIIHDSLKLYSSHFFLPFFPALLEKAQILPILPRNEATMWNWYWQTQCQARFKASLPPGQNFTTLCVLIYAFKLGARDRSIKGK